VWENLGRKTRTGATPGRGTGIGPQGNGKRWGQNLVPSYEHSITQKKKYGGHARFQKETWGGKTLLAGGLPTLGGKHQRKVLPDRTKSLESAQQKKKKGIW